ncbi:MAG: type II toxin-antitoxin system VapC family toxin [Sulfuricella sp.]
MLAIIDASVLVSAFKADEEQHATSLEFLRVAIERSVHLCAPAILFPEMAAAFSRPGRNSPLASRIMEQIRVWTPIRIYPVDESLALAAEHVALECFIRGADAIYAALANQLGAPLVSWDRELLARAPAGAHAMTPENWLSER